MFFSLSVLALVAVVTAYAAVNYKPAAVVAPIIAFSAFNAARIQFPCQTLTSALAASWNLVGVSATPPTQVLEEGVHPSKAVLAVTAAAATLAYQ